MMDPQSEQIALLEEQILREYVRKFAPLLLDLEPESLTIFDDFLDNSDTTEFFSRFIATDDPMFLVGLDKKLMKGK